MIVPFTSDKGLCGGVNSSIVREIKHIVNVNREAYKIFTIGEKSTVALVRPFPDLLVYSINQILTPINFPTACSVGHNILAAGSDCDNILIVYNEFKNAISQV